MPVFQFLIFAFFELHKLKLELDEDHWSFIN